MKTTCLFVLLAMMFPFRTRAADLGSDERIVFFPTCGWLDEAAGVWRLPIHTWVYEPEEESIRRKAAISLLRRALGLDDEAAETELFRARARLFLVDNERDRVVQVRIAGKVFDLPPTGTNGQSRNTITLTPAEAEAALADDLLASAESPGGWLTLEAVLGEKDTRRFKGAVQLVSAEGWSVISDVDDTIKISEVRDKRKLMRNTLLKEYAAAPGMSDAYVRHAAAGAVFHYVSASPWQLFGPLDEFRAREKYPPGSFHMKLFRAKDMSAKNLLTSPDEYKPGEIEPLLAAWPRRKFLLIGDSGERDPEIYGELARKHSAQIAGIAIRNVTDEPADAARFVEAFRDVPREKWRVFTDATDLNGLVPAKSE